MNKEFKCPSCGTTFSDRLPDVCPVCGLEELNVVFTSEEDYVAWKTEIQSQWKLSKSRVFAGYDGALILLENGDLYGVGNNDGGRYSPDPALIGKQLKEPQFIASCVRSAAAGYNYSLYVNYAGEIVFMGNSGVPYAERFRQPAPAREVYAAPDKDVFWMTDVNGILYVWGNNLDEALQTRTKKKIEAPESLSIERTVSEDLYEGYLIHHCSIYSHKEIAHYQFRSISDSLSQNHCEEKDNSKIERLILEKLFDSHISDSTSLELYGGNIEIKYKQNKESLISRTKTELSRNTHKELHLYSEYSFIYCGFSRQFGSTPTYYLENYPNADVFTAILSPKSLGTISEEKLSVDFRISVFCNNRYIFEPIHADAFLYYPSSIKHASGLIRKDSALSQKCDLSLFQDAGTHTIVKGPDQTVYLMHLSKEGVLQIGNPHGESYRSIGKITDYSVAGSIWKPSIYLLTTDCTLYRANLVMLIENGVDALEKLGAFQ